MLEGWEQRNARRWEQTRVIAYNILAVNRDPKKGFPSIKEYMPLRSDPVIDEQSEAARLQKVMDDYKAKILTRK